MRVKIEVDTGGVLNEQPKDEEERDRILGNFEEKVSVND